MKRLLSVICMLGMGSLASAQSDPPLDSAQTLAILGASTVTNTGPTVITGDSNGAPNAVVTPTIGLGKGWRNFDVQSTVGVAIPVADLDTLGTPVFYNTAFLQSCQKAVARIRGQCDVFPEWTESREQAGFPIPGIDGRKIPPVETAWICCRWWYSDRGDTLPYVQPQCRIDRAVSVLSPGLKNVSLSTYDGAGQSYIELREHIGSVKGGLCESLPFCFPCLSSLVPLCAR